MEGGIGMAMKKYTLALFALLFFVSLPPAARGGVSFGPQAVIDHRSKSVSPPAALLGDDGMLYVAWTEEEKEGISGDYGKRFSPEVKVNGAEDAPLSAHEPPAMALGPKGEIYLAWSSKRSGGPFASDLMVARSTDGGRSFWPSARVNDNKVPASAGFASIAIAPDGAVYAAWLDGREKEAKGPATFIAVSRDGGRSFAANTPVDYGSCPCCRTALATGSDGSVVVAWRKTFPGDVREVVVSSGKGAAFGAPAIVGNDRWEIAGCPHRGPSVMADGRGGLFVSWYAEIDGEPGIFLAASADGGKSFTKERIAHKKGFPDNVTSALRGEELLLAWQETTPVASDIIFESRESGKAFRLKLNSDARKAGSPVISVNGKGEVLVAWQKQDMRNFKTIFVIGR